ncbi:MAG: hypothetical protein WC383_05360 [Gammaproteobacteria bacterium]
MNELILNFVNQYKHPFTAELAAEMTAIELDQVRPVLADLLADKTIKLISVEEGIYVRSNRYNPIVGYGVKSDWRFDQEAALILLDLIEAGNYSSVRKIAAAYGRSRQWVFVYMEALVSIGCIGMSGKTYLVHRKDNVAELGTRIEAGCLGRLRPTISEEEKQRKAAEKEERRIQRLAKQEQIRLELEEKARIVKAWDKYINSSQSWKMCFHEYLKKTGQV